MAAGGGSQKSKLDEQKELLHCVSLNHLSIVSHEASELSSAIEELAQDGQGATAFLGPKQRRSYAASLFPS